MLTVDDPAHHRHQRAPMQSTQLSAPDSHGTAHETVHVAPTKGMGQSPSYQGESTASPSESSVEPEELGWLEQIMSYVGCAVPRTRPSDGVWPEPRNDLLACCGTRAPYLEENLEPMEGFWAPTKVVAASIDGGLEASPTDVRTAVLAHPTRPPARSPGSTPEPPPRRSWNKNSSPEPPPRRSVRELAGDSPAPAAAPPVMTYREFVSSVSEPPGGGTVAPEGEFSLTAALAAAAQATAQAAEAAAAALAAFPTFAPVEPVELEPLGSAPPSPGLGRYRGGSDTSLLSYCTGDSEVELLDEELIAPPPQQAEPSVETQPPVGTQPSAVTLPATQASAQQLGGDTEEEGAASTEAPSSRVQRRPTWRKLRAEVMKGDQVPAPSNSTSSTSGASSGGTAKKMGRQSSFERMRSVGRRMRGLSAQSNVQAGAAEAAAIRSRPGGYAHVTTDPPAATCPPTTSATRPSSRWSVGGTAVGAYEEFAGGAVGGAVDGAVTGAAGAFPQGVGWSARVESS